MTGISLCIISPAVENSMEFLLKIKNRSYDPAIKCLNIYTTELNQDLEEIFVLPGSLQHYSQQLGGGNSLNVYHRMNG
jgi:hypothetical protein